MFRRPALAFGLALALTAVALADPPVIETAEKVSGEVGAFIPLRTKTDGAFTRFVVIDKGLNVFPADLLNDKKATVVSAPKAGTYRLVAFTGNADGPSEPVWIYVTVGTPTPPKPDDPQPKPDDPPAPPVPPAPIPEPGFRVLFVYEKDDMTTYPRGQTNAMGAKVVVDYLQAKCVKGPDGKTPEVRWYDKDVPMDNAAKLWQDAMKLPRTELPWLVVSDGKTGYAGPVPYSKTDPTDVSPLLNLLKKIGG